MDKTLINAFRTNDAPVLKAFYHSSRSVFLNFGKKYGLDEADLLDVFQESFIAFRRLALNGKLDDVSSSAQTYLFGIGRKKMYDRLKEKKRSVPFDPNLIKEDSEEPMIVEDAPELNPRQLKMQKHFKSLGQKCREVLTLFYYRGLTIEEITTIADYSNPNVVKAHKSRCLKTLRKLMMD